MHQHDESKPCIWRNGWRHWLMSYSINYIVSDATWHRWVHCGRRRYVHGWRQRIVADGTDGNDRRVWLNRQVHACTCDSTDYNWRLTALINVWSTECTNFRLMACTAWCYVRIRLLKHQVCTRQRCMHGTDKCMADRRHAPTIQCMNDGMHQYIFICICIAEFNGNCMSDGTD